MPTPTVKWVTPTGQDVCDAFSNIFAPQNNGEKFDPKALADTWMPLIVDMFRGAIRNGNRTALSKSPGSVPPEAKGHVVVLVAEAVIVNSQRMAGYIVLDGPMARMIIAARTFLKIVATGNPVSEPVDPDPNTLPSGTQWGDDSGPGTAASCLTDLTIDAPPF